MRSQRTDDELRAMIRARQGIAGYKQSVEEARKELEQRERERAAEAR